MHAIALPLVAMLAQARSYRETISRARLSTRFLSRLLLPWCGHRSRRSQPSPRVRNSGSSAWDCPIRCKPPRRVICGADRNASLAGGDFRRDREPIAFRIANSPLISKASARPGADGHVTPYRGQFTLRDNGNGTTTLIARAGTGFTCARCGISTGGRRKSFAPSMCG